MTIFLFILYKECSKFRQRGKRRNRCLPLTLINTKGMSYWLVESKFDAVVLGVVLRDFAHVVFFFFLPLSKF